VPAARRRPLSLDFDAKLYPLAQLRAAAAAWSQVATIAVRKQGARLRVTLTPLPGAPADDVLGGEFANYALGLVCQARRRA
jgi:hypothetical protein